VIVNVVKLPKDPPAPCPNSRARPAAPRPEASPTGIDFENGTKIGARPLVRQPSGGPAASLTIAAPSGTHQVVAVYSGDGDYLPTTSNTSLLTGN
jgi:hypothetical protein